MEKCSEIYILDSHQDSREILKSYLEEFDLGYEIKIFNDYEYGIQEIKKLENSPIVFIDISDSKTLSNNLEEIKLLTSKIIITSTDYSTNTIIKAMRLGAKEFLPKPIIKNDLRRILTILLEENINNDIASKIITIYSNKGGIGKTTIATNLAIELARTTNDKVALIDLNLQLGDISTFLNINPTFDVAYFINNLIDKNEDSLLEAFEKYKETNLYVLSDPTYIEQSANIKPQQIENFFKILRKKFPYIIVDMSSNIDTNSLKILDLADWILFTSIVNIPAIRNAQRCLNLFNSRHYPKDKVKILINRYMENDEIKIEDIENTLGQKIYWKIPNNYFSIMESINKGISVSEVNSSSNIANSFRDLATKISDEAAELALLKYRGI